MSDSTISAVPPQPPQPVQAAPVVVKVASVPPQTPQNAIISGQVVANANNQVAIQTDQGLIVLQASLNIEVGQNVNFKLQPLPQQPTTSVGAPNLVAELLNVSADKVSGSSNVNLQPTDIDPQGVDVSTPVAQQAPIDPVLARDPTAYEEYKPLQALIIQMPDILQDDTLAVMTKSLLQLPISQPLPPSLQEGLDKFNQLTGLLSQANLLPSNTSEASENLGLAQQNIIPNLQQLLQPDAGKNALPNPLLSQDPHQFVQLQTVQPGENLSPNILVNIKDQLLTLLQPQDVAAATKTPSLMQSLMPESLSDLLDKAGTALQSKLPQFLVPNGALPQEEISQPQSPLFTLPAIGLVLGAPPHDIPDFANANLVLMTTPQKQDGQNPLMPAGQLIGLLAPQEDTPHSPLLPGTILVAALKPQTDKLTSFAVLPEQLIAPIIDSFAPLHPSLGENWPALQDLWQQVIGLQSSDPSRAAQMANPLQQIIPSPTPQQLPPTMLFFLSILKNNFTSDWMPAKHFAGLEKIDTDALVKTLSQDLQAIKSRMDDSQPADSWRPLPLPLQVGDQLLRLQWFYRHPDASYERKPGEDEETLNKKRKTRFLLNIPKTMLGDMQIDGLVQERNLDLILRTETMLPSQMETAIRGRYTAVLETTGMIGGINFQSGRAHYVHV